jgi:exosortase C (VPDSG-CTERM-specific)
MDSRGNSPKPVLSFAALVIGFALPLFQLARFALSSDLYSYIILVPLISGYLIWLKKDSLRSIVRPGRPLLVPTILGIVALGAFWTITLSGKRLGMEDALSLETLSFVLLFWGICGWSLGKQAVHAVLFPLGFMIFLVPFPTFFKDWLEGQLQYLSADAALGLFRLSGMPVYYDNLTFHLSDISLQVAPECSGIHSSLALFITSLVAGYLFLRSNLCRTLLALSVLPFAILRNGFRIFTLGELCVHIGPEMIDSNIHHRGGPLFFAIALVPFLYVLYLLVKSERRLSPNPKLNDA